MWPSFSATRPLQHHLRQSWVIALNRCRDTDSRGAYRMGQAVESVRRPNGRILPFVAPLGYSLAALTDARSTQAATVAGCGPRRRRAVHISHSSLVGFQHRSLSGSGSQVTQSPIYSGPAPARNGCSGSCSFDSKRVSRGLQHWLAQSARCAPSQAWRTNAHNVF
jgi:hypothetical protein